MSYGDGGATYESGRPTCPFDGKKCNCLPYEECKPPYGHVPTAPVSAPTEEGTAA